MADHVQPSTIENQPKSAPNWRELLKPVVIVGALGYFVDIYDLILFSIVRTESLMALGYEGADLLKHGIFLLNAQMIGMLVGGILFGVLGDRKGRVQLLFGSILLYSLANIANGFVHNLELYAVLRFIAGVGLAGELGGCITLVSEVLSKEMRGYGTAIVATVGVLGAVVGGLVADLVNWRYAYFIGGGMGLALLFLRMKVSESGMFNQLRENRSTIERGQFLSLFTDWARFAKYMRCILIGLPLWFVVGILVTFSPEFAKSLEIQGSVTARYAVMAAYAGLTLGDFLSGFMSQWMRSRKKVVAGFLAFTTLMIAVYFSAQGQSASIFYGIIFVMGIGIGYWAVFVTIAAEQFGTNIRATVATTVPNFVRGTTVPITMAFTYAKDALGIQVGTIVVAAICITIAYAALFWMQETYGKELDYLER
ncbi:MAG: MFS transporter [Verrucomicrobiota bacterium]|nr:MFS transporter [Verrucomicrobiota bacterium]